MNLLIPQNKNEIHKLVDELETYGGLKPAEIKTIKEYHEELQKTVEHKEFTIRHLLKNNPQKDELIKEAETEFEWIDFIVKYRIYTTSYASLFNMNQLVDHLFRAKPENSYFDFKQLVEWVNAYFKIDNPYKAPNKIAYGWNFSLDKSKPYLYGCIRNYLNKNGVKFETVELQKICALKIVDTNGE